MIIQLRFDKLNKIKVIKLNKNDKFIFKNYNLKAIKFK